MQLDDVRRLVRYLSGLGISTLYLSPILRVPRQHPRLRHGRPSSDRSATGDGRELAGAGRGTAAMRNGPDARHRPESHGDRRPTQCLVARRARKRPMLAVCPVFRHRLVAAEAGAARQNLAGDSGDQFGKVLEEGQIRLAYENRRFVVECQGASCRPIRAVGRQFCRTVQVRPDGSELQEVDEHVEWARLIVALDGLPATSDVHPDAIQRRARQEDLCQRLATLIEGSCQVAPCA